MPIEFKCQCGQRLKVADSNAGKRAKCPKCQAELRVPDVGAASNPAASNPAAGNPASASGPTQAPAFSAPAFSAPAFGSAPAMAPAARMWTVQTQQGEQYGPISKAELDQWLAEGRLDENCQLLEEGGDQWKWANEVYPSLGAVAASGGGPVIKADNPFDFSSAYQSPSTGGSSGGYSSGGSYTYVKPHRGTAVLVLGILSIVLCPIMGVAAWMMGTADLREMRSGRMDRSGEGQTQAGQICGIIGTVILAINLVIVILYFVLIAGVIAAAAR